MTSSRPYLIRAMYQWIVDNGMTPYLLVDCSSAAVRVPKQFEENGRIVLNIGPMAVSGLTLGNDEVSFSARFDGRAMNVLVPVPHIMAIYTRENGQGMMFGDEEQPPPEPESRSRPQLKVVK
ncbi:MAG: ClpXP protease specificity-enhancing factor [Gammaproteobacteria bacterium]